MARDGQEPERFPVGGYRKRIRMTVPSTVIGPDSGLAGKRAYPPRPSASKAPMV